MSPGHFFSQLTARWFLNITRLSRTQWTSRQCGTSYGMASECTISKVQAWHVKVQAWHVKVQAWQYNIVITCASIDAGIPTKMHMHLTSDSYSTIVLTTMRMTLRLDHY